MRRVTRRIIPAAAAAAIHPTFLSGQRAYRLPDERVPSIPAKLPVKPSAFTPEIAELSLHFRHPHNDLSNSTNNNTSRLAIFIIAMTAMAVATTLSQENCKTKQANQFDFENDKTFEGKDLTFDNIKIQFIDQLKRGFGDDVVNQKNFMTACLGLFNGMAQASPAIVIYNLEKLAGHPAFPLVLAYTIDMALLSNENRTASHHTDQQNYQCNKTLLFALHQAFAKEMAARTQFLANIAGTAQAATIQPRDKFFDSLRGLFIYEKQINGRMVSKLAEAAHRETLSDQHLLEKVDTILKSAAGLERRVYIIDLIKNDGSLDNARIEALHEKLKAYAETNRQSIGMRL